MLTKNNKNSLFTLKLIKCRPHTNMKDQNNIWSKINNNYFKIYSKFYYNCLFKQLKLANLVVFFLQDLATKNATYMNYLICIVNHHTNKIALVKSKCHYPSKVKIAQNPLWGWTASFNLLHYCIVLLWSFSSIKA